MRSIRPNSLARCAEISAGVDDFLGLGDRERPILDDRRDHFVVQAIDQRVHVLANRFAELSRVIGSA